MAVIGLKDLHYAVITKEDREETVYGPVKRLGPAQAFNLSPSVNRANLRADDQVLFSHAAKGATAVTLNTAYLEKEVEAEILGKELDENGGITDSGDDDAPYVAVGGRAENANGGFDYFWVYRIKFAPADENRETKQETPTYQTPSLSGEAIPRVHDGLEKYKIYERDPDANPAVIAAWFEEVIDKNYVPGA